jgi:hypothetical protein
MTTLTRLAAAIAMTCTAGGAAAADIGIQPTGKRFNIIVAPNGEEKTLHPSFKAVQALRPVAATNETETWRAMDFVPTGEQDANKRFQLQAAAATICPEPVENAATRKKAWEQAYTCLSQHASRTSLTDNVKLLAIEPEMVIATDRATRARKLVDASGGPSEVWGYGVPGWHLDKSGLRTAFYDVYIRGAAAPTVLIGHLDTGYVKDNGDGNPEYFSEALSRYCPKDSECEPGGEATGSWHGSGTLSSLAGKFTRNGKTMSGNPKARVFSVNIHDSVVHLDSRRMAKGIQHAIDVNADVVTLSAGGLPSGLLIKAVNNAYEAGMPIFAATGDFFHIPLVGKTFTSVGYPARYARVMGVAGITYDGKSYGLPPSKKWLLKFGKNWKKNVGSWMLRGNYGPEYVMRENVIAAYAPNVIRIKPSSSGPVTSEDGAGTSYSTPQAAAAASLWIEANRTALDARTLRWAKAEAVYQVLVRSAEQKPGDVLYFGRGVLRADEALKWRYVEDGSKAKIVKRTDDNQVLEVELSKRPAAARDIAGVMELLLSAKLPLGLEGHLKMALVRALLAELAQIMMSSEELEQFAERKMAGGSDLVSGRASMAALADIVERDKDASDTLKKALHAAAATD